MNPTEIEFSLIIPVRNEREGLLAFLAEIQNTLTVLHFEVLVIDDGSTDGVSSSLKGRFAGKVISTSPRGKTAALRTGKKAARGRYLICVDGDGQYHPQDIFKIYKHLQAGADLVSGVRINRCDPWPRLVASFLANWFVQIYFGTKQRDVCCGLVGFRKSLPFSWEAGTHRIFPVLAEKFNFKVVRIDISHRDRLAGKSKYGWGVKNRLVETIFLFWNLRHLSRLQFLFGSERLNAVLPTSS